MSDSFDYYVYLPLPQEKGLFPLGEVRLLADKKLSVTVSKPQTEEALVDLCRSFNQKEMFKLTLEEEIPSLLDNWVKLVEADAENLQDYIPQILEQTFGVIARLK